MDENELTRELPLEQNEFTVSELLTYLRTVYGSKVNGSKFTGLDIINWIRLKKLPECYGGHNIRTYRASGIRILVLTRLEREDVKMTKEMMKKEKPRPKPKKKPIKRRTELYYQLARTKPASQSHILPTNYRELGIRNNQIHRKK